MDRTRRPTKDPNPAPEFFSSREVNSGLAVLLSLRPEDIAREPELGSQLNFRDGVILVQAIQSLLRQIVESHREAWPQQAFRSLENTVKGIEQVVSEIQNFKAETSNPTQHRHHLLQQLDQRFHDLAKDASPVLFALNADSAQAALQRLPTVANEVIAPVLDTLEAKRDALEAAIQDVQQKSSEALKTQEDQLAQHVAQIDALERQAADALAAARDAAGNSAVAEHAKDFKTAASSSGKSALKWLLATLAFASLTAGAIAFALWLHWTHPPSGTSTVNVQFAIGQLSLLSLLFFLVVFSARSYRANRHLQTLNEHRATALTTFAAFAAAARDPDAKAAVLIQTTQAIFSQQPTGFLPAEAESGATPLSVLEIVRSSKQPGSS